MIDFIWIASFPKSGNTWFRFIAAHLLFEPGDDSVVINSMIPDIHAFRGELEYRHDDAFVCKTHWAFDIIPHHRIGFRKAIYIIRHPLDVVASSIRYMTPELDPSTVNEITNEFLQTGTLLNWDQIGTSSWGFNVKTWYDATDNHDIMFIRYEDAQADPVANVRKVGEFLGVERSDARIEEIARITSFDSMKAAEERELETKDPTGFFTGEAAWKDSNFRFMNSGKIGGYADVIPADAIDALKTKWSEVMEHFGYE